MSLAMFGIPINDIVEALMILGIIAGLFALRSVGKHHRVLQEQNRAARRATADEGSAYQGHG